MINVLIVEDDFRIAGVHEKFLQNIEGVQVVGKALNGQEALQVVKEKPVDLLLLDIYMPDKLGTEVINDIRNRYHHIDFIVITAANQKEFFEESMQQGVFSYLIKPITVETFTKVIESYKERRRLLESREYVDQEFINTLLNNPSTFHQERSINQSSLPKGINALTLENVIEIIDGAKDGMTAEEVGEKMGASRTTARRYLEYLVSVKKVEAKVEYGIVGRPERKYFS